MEKYLKVRSQMKTGDCLQWRSRTALGWIIRLFTRANVNHTGLVITFDKYDGRHRYTLEAMEHGIQLRLLSNRLGAFKGSVWWYPLQDQYNPLRAAIGAWSLLEIGTKYDYKSLIKQTVCRVSADARSLFCSEYAFLAWKNAGIQLPDGPAPRPGDIPDLKIFKDPVQIL